MQFSDKEKAILAFVQDNLPDSLTPFADIAAQVGASEEDVLNLLNTLKNTGVIRRFGATIRHQKTGWTHNAMVAWRASEEDAEQWAKAAIAHPRISHAYYRPSAATDWPYTLYTMIHGRSQEECLEVVEELKKMWPLQDYAFLVSLRELKKTSMKYFS